MNAVLIAVIVMLVLALLRVHVVVALFLGAIVGGLMSGMGLDATMVAFQDGLGGGAKIALSYALLGAFAMGVASAGLPQILANFLIRKLGGSGEADPKAALATKWMLILGLIAMSVMSQNLIPVHIAFIPLIVPPLLKVMNKLRLDRRLITTCLTFGLITTYMFIPVGFGSIYLNDILLFNIQQAGLDTSDINIMQVQIVMQALDFESDGLMVGALTGLGILLLTGAVDWKHADDVFTNGMKMMALIGFIMITAQGFASVMTATNEVGPLVDATANLFGTNKVLSAGAMLVVGLVVTMGIGSSFSTLPIISVIYVPLCMSLGFSPAATVALIGTAGALGDAGSPASDSTLGPSTSASFLPPMQTAPATSLSTPPDCTLICRRT